MLWFFGRISIREYFMGKRWAFFHILANLELSKLLSIRPPCLLFSQTALHQVLRSGVGPLPLPPHTTAKLSQYPPVKLLKYPLHFRKPEVIGPSQKEGS
jgi:hypothetical protein